MVLIIRFSYAKSFHLFFKGVAVNGNEEILPAVNTTVTKITESIVPLTTGNETTIVSAGTSEEAVITTIIEEATKTTEVLIEGEPSANENVPIEGQTDGMDTAE